MATQTIHAQSLLDYFDESTLKKGERYFYDGRVTKVELVNDGVFVAKVSGTRDYESRVFVDLNESMILDTHCTCPIIVDCKHAAAALFAFISIVRSTGTAPCSARGNTSPRIPSLSIVPTNDKSGRSPLSPTEKRELKEFMPRCDTPETERKLEQLLPSPEILNSFKYLAQVRAAHQGARSTEPPPRKNSHERSYAPRNCVVYLITSSYIKTRVHVCAASTKRDGSLGKIRQLTVGSFLGSSQPAYATGEDVDICEFWAMIRPHWDQENLDRTLPELATILIKKIVSTGRCYFQDTDGQPLSLGPELPAQLEWIKSSAGDYSLELVAQDNGELYACLPWNHHWYLDPEKNVIGPAKSPVVPEVLNALTAMRRISESELRGLPLVISKLGLTDLIPMPPCSDAVKLDMVAPVPTLEISLEQDSTAPGVRRPVARISFETPEDKAVTDEGKLVLRQYDKDKERKLKEKLADLGLQETDEFGSSPGSAFFAAKPEQWQKIHEQLPGLQQEGWRIPAETASVLTPIEVSDNDLYVELEQRNNWWFELDLNITVDGRQMSLLPLLRAAVRQLPPNQKIVDTVGLLNNNGKFRTMLDDGRFISIPFERIKAIVSSLGELLQHDLQQDHISASAIDLQRLFDETLSHNRWIGAEKAQDLLDRLRRLGAPCPVASPESLNATLRPYQLEGVRWLQTLAREGFGGLLADDMGLGKTMQILSHICLEKEGKRLQDPFLVICPTSVLPNWINEAEKFAPDLKVLAHYGTDRWSMVDSFKGYDLVVTTYSLISRDAEKLKKINWHGIAIDEAQAIKNAKTEVARIVRNLKAGHRFCVTGTPIENNLGELWSHFHFVLPGLLGDEKTFNASIRHPIERHRNLSRKASLQTRIRPFLLRRTKQEVATELPPKTTTIQHVELEGAQRDLYETVRLASCEQVRKEIASKGFKQSQIIILDALLKLRQACCDPRLVKLTAASKVKESAKLDALMEMITQQSAEGRKMLVFSQFTSMLDLIADRLNEEKIRYVELRGDTRHRSIPIKQFQNGDYPVFLLSLKAGGVGLNLTAADVVVHYDPWWNPAVEDQATDRAHRIGQDKHVFVYKFIARGTIEQRMLELQNRKRELAAGIYDENGGLSAALTENDLMTLLSPIDAEF